MSLDGQRTESAGCESALALDVRAVLEHTTDAVFIVDRDWRFTFLNSRASTEFGRGRELLGRDLWEEFPELGATAFGRAYRAAAADGRPTEVEDFYTPFGNWYSANAWPLPAGMVVFFRNISPQKRDEAALDASERRFLLLFETMTQGVAFQDLDGAIVDANPAAEQILGVPLLQVRGRRSSDPRWQAVDEDGRPLADDQHPTMMALRTRRTVRGQVIGIFNPVRGERRWLQIDAIPQFRPGQSEPYQVYALFSDITDHKQAETELKESTARLCASQLHLARAQRLAAVGSAEVDFRTGRWEWSDEAYRIYGVDKATFSPSWQAQDPLVHADDRERYRAGIKTARDGIAPEPLEYKIVRPDGEVRVIYREAEIIRDENGAAVGAIATKRDITEIRASERRQSQLMEQLQHAQRIDALGTLAGGIAHDLNNTLVPIVALTEMVKQSLPSDSVDAESLHLVHLAALRARDLVRQILAFSRRKSPETRVTDIAAFLSDSMHLLRASVPTTIAIKERIGAVPPVLVDPAQLHQVVLNLVTNASQAIGACIGTITIEVAEGDEAGATASAGASGPTGVRYVRLTVADSGCGMDDETRGRMFEPFFTTKQVSEGCGLGLSVVHGIVTGHGGHIRVVSRPDHGSRFDIFLPALSRDEMTQDSNGMSA